MTNGAKPPVATDLLAAATLPPEAARVLVAFSGGLDSTVLLHALARPGRYDVAAIHVHHGLQPAADDWADRCRSIAATLNVRFEVRRVDVRRGAGDGPEAAARDARYAALRDAMRSGDVLATAHHRDDQAETILLRLLRGAGPRGLAGMESSRAFGPGILWRPLLETPRSRLREYANANGLSWIEDPHNADARYARSFLRHALMPRIAQRWPGAVTSLVRAATLEREAAQLLDVLADEDLARLRPVGADATGLPIEALLALESARRHNLVRRWIETLGLPVPFRETLQHLEAEVLRAAADATPVLAWPGGEFRRYRDTLFAMRPLPPAPERFSVAWNGEGACRLSDGCGELSGTGIGRCVVVVPIPDKQFQPAGSAHHRTLKNLFQESGVPPWIRPRTPGIERDGQLVWIGAIGWAEGAARGEIAWRGGQEAAAQEPRLRRNPPTRTSPPW